MAALRKILVVTVLAAAAAYCAALGITLFPAMAPTGAGPARESLIALGLPWTLLAHVLPHRWHGALVVIAPAIDVAIFVGVIVLLVRIGRSKGAARPAERVLAPPGPPLGIVPASSIAAAIAVTVVLGWWLVDPAPPGRIALATGPDDGFYQSLGQRYEFFLSPQGVEVDLIPTAGTPENLDLLEANEVDVGFVQGGVAPRVSQETPLRTLATLAIEPLWLFSRGERTFLDLIDQPGLVIAAGEENSGTRAFLHRLLNLLGIDGEVELAPLSGPDAVDALIDGDVDVAAFVTASQTPAVERLIAEPGIGLVEAEGIEALLRHLPFAQRVTLPERSVSFRDHIPNRDIHMIGAATALIVHESLHPAVKQLILQVTGRVARGDRVLGTWGDFPSADLTEFELDPEAERYFTYGPTVVRRYLPYWAANLLERFWIVIIPVATLLLPVIRFGPSTVVWGIRRRIYRHYRDLRELEAAAEAAQSDEERARALSALSKVEGQLKDIVVPLPYRDELYRLRTHAAFVRDRLTRDGTRADDAALPTEPTTTAIAPALAQDRSQ